MSSMQVALPNSIVLILDRSVGKIPETMSGKLVASTSTCIAVGTLSEHDGTTHISLGTSLPPDAVDILAFDGVIATPGRRVAACSVLDEVVLEIDTLSSESRIRVWVNDHEEPTRIDIVIAPVPALREAKSS